MRPEASPIDLGRLAASSLLGTREARKLFRTGADELDTFWNSLPKSRQDEISDLAVALERRQIGLAVLSDAAYPERLLSLRSPPPFLFTAGNANLLAERCIGFSGSRDASQRILSTATECAELAVGAGFVVVAGFSRGVDASAHRAALASGESTVAVLPEGILQATLEIDIFGETMGPSEELLFVSQFPPRAPWIAGRAMARNVTVAALSECLVLAAAQETGGSFDAGKAALKVGRRVLAPAWPDGLTLGAERLCELGAERVCSPAEFEAKINSLEAGTAQDDAGSRPDQLFELD